MNLIDGLMVNLINPKVGIEECFLQVVIGMLPLSMNVGHINNIRHHNYLWKWNSDWPGHFVYTECRVVCPRDLK